MKIWNEKSVKYLFFGIQAGIQIYDLQSLLEANVQPAKAHRLQEKLSNRIASPFIERQSPFIGYAITWSGSESFIKREKKQELKKLLLYLGLKH